MVLVEEHENYDNDFDDFDPESLSTEELRKEVERLRQQVEEQERAQNYRGQHAPEGPDPSDRSLDELSRYTPWTGEGDPPPGAIPLQMQQLKYSNGDTYEGEVLGTKRHGKGLHSCASGDYYDGDWRDDVRDGRGRMVFVNGLTYEGDWKNDKAEGHGICEYETGHKYTGDWKNDHRWGWGLFEMKGGDVYEGEWVDDIMEGKGRGRVKALQDEAGKYSVKDGSVEYVGQWRDGLRHGHGTYHQTGLYKYLGEWARDMRHGQGKCIFMDGTVYD
eukprot:gene12832-15165_t